MTVIWGEPEAAWREGERSQATQLGLTSIRERAEMMGASFAVESEPGSGTRIRVEKELQKG